MVYCDDNRSTCEGQVEPPGDCDRWATPCESLDIDIDDGNTVDPVIVGQNDWGTAGSGSDSAMSGENGATRSNPGSSCTVAATGASRPAPTRPGLIMMFGLALALVRRRDGRHP